MGGAKRYPSIAIHESMGFAKGSTHPTSYSWMEEMFLTVEPTSGRQSRSRKSGQDDKWNFCLTTAIIAVNRRDHEETTPPEPLSGLQGEGGAGRRQGRPNDSPAGRAFRRFILIRSQHGNRSLKAALRRFSDREAVRKSRPRSM